MSTSVSSSRIETLEDPFVIPRDYTWVTAEAKKKKMQEKNKAKKGRSRRDWLDQSHEFDPSKLKGVRLVQNKLEEQIRSRT